MTDVTGDVAGPATGATGPRPRVPTVVLRALGVAIFAALLTAAGLWLRWEILRDQMYATSNLEIAQFIIGVGAAVGVGAMIVVATGLVRARD